MELVALMKDGIPPLTAWYGATGLAGQQVGQEDVGMVATGYRADLLVCKEDVLDRPELFEQGALVEVIKDWSGLPGWFVRIPLPNVRTLCWGCSALEASKYYLLPAQGREFYLGRTRRLNLDS